MGEHEVHQVTDDEAQRNFVRALLEDVQALERMLAEGALEVDVRRIGAEQEFFLADAAGRPSDRALEVLEHLDENFTTELGRFNLEANLPPAELGGRCLSDMERMLGEMMARASEAAGRHGTQVVLCGILPTLGKEHLTLDWMTPISRYHRLNQVMSDLRGGRFRTLIKGLDELQETHDNVMFEACNTSFQVHFQVGGSEFARLYNLAQVVTAPVLAAAVNSPVFLQHRLWHETRVALFQQSLDMRSETQTRRGHRQRVSFGERWVEESVLEIFREDISRFRVLIATDLEESPLKILDEGGVPSLRALCLHNGTVYRWNRPCYGVNDGVPHLRIENRVLPAGPTLVDEVANAALYFGLMLALGDGTKDVRDSIEFDDAKENFMAAARYGLKARFRWLDGLEIDAGTLILEQLLPLARTGLAGRGIARADIDRYLGVIEGRVSSGRTGAKWMLDSLAAMDGAGTADERSRALATAIAEKGVGADPVHTWPLAGLVRSSAARESYRTIGQVMSRSLFTVHPDDVVDLAASLMDWEHIRHVPVEDHDGRLVGIVTHRQLLRMVGRGLRGDDKPIAVREIMKDHPVVVSPDTPTQEAIETMRKNRVGCLPVVDGEKLVGIVTETDFIRVAADLLDRWLSEDG